MPHSYAPQFRAMVVEQVRSGGEWPRWPLRSRSGRRRCTAGCARTASTAVSCPARRRWTTPSCARPGDGSSSCESELTIVKRASALFDEGRVVRPKAVFDIVESFAREGHSTKRVCRLLRVALSGFFRWRTKPPSDRAIRRAWLTDVILAIHDQSRATYGWRRIRRRTADVHGQQVNKKLIRAIMAEQAISGLPTRRKGKPKTAQRATTEDLVNRVFHRDGPNQLYDRHHRAPDPRRQALLLRRARRLVPAGGRLAARAPASHPETPWCTATTARKHLLDIQSASPCRRAGSLLGHHRRRVRQRRGRVVLGSNADRAPRHPQVGYPDRALHGRLRLGRGARTTSTAPRWIPLQRYCPGSEPVLADGKIPSDTGPLTRRPAPPQRHHYRGVRVSSGTAHSLLSRRGACAVRVGTPAAAPGWWLRDRG